MAKSKSLKNRTDWNNVNPGDPCPIKTFREACGGIMKLVKFTGHWFVECSKHQAHCRMAAKEEAEAAEEQLNKTSSGGQ